MNTTNQLKLNNSVVNSNQHLQHMVEDVKDYAIFLLDAKGCITTWNTGAEHIKGYQPEEVIGRNFSLFYTIEDIEANKPEHALNIALSEGRFEDTGWRIRKDGSKFWANVIITPLRDSSGSLQGFTKITRDLTEQRKTEEKFKGMLESAPDAIIIVNSKGLIEMVNVQTEKLFGFDRSEIVGKEVELLIPERFQKIHYHHRRDYHSDPKVRPMGTGLELFGKRKDGTEFPVEISLSPVEIDDEGVLVFASIRDITSQKKAREEIKKLNEELDQLIAKRTAELKLALDNEKKAREEAFLVQQKIVFLSKASALLSSSLDYFKTLGELAGIITPAIADWCIFHEVQSNGIVDPVIISHTDKRKIELGYELARKYPSDPNISKSLYKVVQTRQPIFFPAISDKLLEIFTGDSEYLGVLRNMQIRSLISVPLFIHEQIYGIMTLILEGEGRQFDEKDLEMAKEIAHRASLAIENGRLYKEAQNLNAELEKRVAGRTSELEAMNKELESFSYSVSHDLRAPLRSIDGFSNIILNKYSDRLDETGKDYFMRVIHACQQMGQLIDDLLKLSKITRIEMKREDTDLSEIVKAIVEELQASQPGRKAAFKIQQGLIANADRNLMKIALHNLLDNSWKYSKYKSITKIEFGMLIRDDKKVYYIRDNGVGFDMKYSDKLFGAFQRLHDKTEFEGTGIGLATVQRIIRRHGGNIRAEAKVDRGAVFYFSL